MMSTIVIGANYGDEGKGLATHYFSRKAKEKGELCLNILFNGGCQRGHTVERKNGTRHVFHHFGSGTFDGADTSLADEFIVNPIFFRKEDERLGDRTQTCYISPYCRVSTPYDAFINQMVEKSRAEERHGSCGFGIWETAERYKTIWDKTAYDLMRMSDKEILIYLEDMSQSFVKRRLDEYGIDVDEEYRDLLSSDILRIRWTDDFRYMMRRCEMSSAQELFERYDELVFEGGQGLALDGSDEENYPHVTASRTGSAYPLKLLENFACEKEICYVTRTYFTRHGAGSFPTECAKEEIGEDLLDETNIENEFQGALRFGQFSEEEMMERIRMDAGHYGDQIKKSIMITHFGKNKSFQVSAENLLWFDNVYLSDSRFGVRYSLSIQEE